MNLLLGLNAIACKAGPVTLFYNSRSRVEPEMHSVKPATPWQLQRPGASHSKLYSCSRLDTSFAGKALHVSSTVAACLFELACTMLDNTAKCGAMK